MGTRTHTYGRPVNTRRQFFGVAVLAIAGAAALALSAADPGPDLREVWRYSYATDRWARCRMYELRSGDVFRLGDVGVFRAVSDPVKGPDGVWGITADTQIDPATNEWVDAGS